MGASVGISQNNRKPPKMWHTRDQEDGPGFGSSATLGFGRLLGISAPGVGQEGWLVSHLPISRRNAAFTCLAANPARLSGLSAATGG